MHCGGKEQITLSNQKLHQTVKYVRCHNHIVSVSLRGNKKQLRPEKYL